MKFKIKDYAYCNLLKYCVILGQDIKSQVAPDASIEVCVCKCQAKFLDIERSTRTNVCVWLNNTRSKKML